MHQRASKHFQIGRTDVIPEDFLYEVAAASGPAAAAALCARDSLPPNDEPQLQCGGIVAFVCGTALLAGRAGPLALPKWQAHRLRLVVLCAGLVFSFIIDIITNCGVLLRDGIVVLLSTPCHRTPRLPWSAAAAKL